MPANVCGNSPTNDFITGYLGPPPSFVEGPSSSFENDGNLVSMSNPDPRWGVENGCDPLPSPPHPPGCYVAWSVIYAAEQLYYSNNAKVYQIFVVTDSGWFFAGGTQTILFKNIHINNQVFFNKVACPAQGDDEDAKQARHAELCEEKAGQDEQENGQTEQGTEQAEQNQQGTDHSGEDLNNADMSGYDFTAANLQGADLSSSNLQGVNFAGADLTCANLAGADLSGANLLGAILDGADLTGANLAGVDLTGVITLGGAVCT